MSQKATQGAGLRRRNRLAQGAFRMYAYETHQILAADRVREAEHGRLVRAARKASRAARRSPGHDTEGPVSTSSLDRAR
ncbi:hypothetical protein ACWCP6_37095, partial [Streptomyces sp. NPDC002004]